MVLYFIFHNSCFLSTFTIWSFVTLVIVKSSFIDKEYSDDIKRASNFLLEDDLFTSYRHYEETLDLFQKLSQTYPKIAKYGSIGKSVQNREIFYLEMTMDIGGYHHNRPKVKLVGNMHGDETIGREIIIYLTQYLLYNQDDPRCRTILENARLYLMPSLNPDGFENSVEGQCETPRNGEGRENANHVDLNRNFPDQFLNTDKNKVYAAETSAMMNWITNNK